MVFVLLGVRLARRGDVSYTATSIKDVVHTSRASICSLNYPDYMLPQWFKHKLHSSHLKCVRLASEGLEWKNLLLLRWTYYFSAISRFLSLYLGFHLTFYIITVFDNFLYSKSLRLLTQSEFQTVAEAWTMLRKRWERESAPVNGPEIRCKKWHRESSILVSRSVISREVETSYFLTDVAF